MSEQTLNFMNPFKRGKDHGDAVDEVTRSKSSMAKVHKESKSPLLGSKF